MPKFHKIGKCWCGKEHKQTPMFVFVPSILPEGMRYVGIPTAEHVRIAGEALERARQLRLDGEEDDLGNV